MTTQSPPRILSNPIGAIKPPSLSSLRTHPKQSYGIPTKAGSLTDGTGNLAHEHGQATHTHHNYTQAPLSVGTNLASPSHIPIPLASQKYTGVILEHGAGRLVDGLGRLADGLGSLASIAHNYTQGRLSDATGRGRLAMVGLEAGRLNTREQYNEASVRMAGKLVGIGRLVGWPVSISGIAQNYLQCSLRWLSCWGLAGYGLASDGAGNCRGAIVVDGGRGVASMHPSDGAGATYQTAVVGMGMHQNYLECFLTRLSFGGCLAVTCFVRRLRQACVYFYGGYGDGHRLGWCVVWGLGSVGHLCVQYI